MRVQVVAPGPAAHGVVRAAGRVAALLAERGVEVVHGGAVDGSVDVVHAHFTDALWGSDVAAAADSFTAWAATSARPLVVTAHDLPDPAATGSSARDARRCAAFRRVLAAVDGVVVCSDHEARRAAPLLVGSGGGRPSVVELPLDPPPAAPVGPPPAPWPAGPTVGVAGFVYPGKGHAEVLDAVAALGGAAVVALGAPSPGHQGMVDELRRRARCAGVELAVTGWLGEAAMAAAMEAATVPVMANRSPSASASLLSWVAAGRRPLVAAGGWCDEVAARHPGVVTAYSGPAELREQVAAALADPTGTWLGVRPEWSDVAGGHLQAYEEARRRRGRC